MKSKKSIYNYVINEDGNEKEIEFKESTDITMEKVLDIKGELLILINENNISLQQLQYCLDCLIMEEI